jgi:hypothetical protein
MMKLLIGITIFLTLIGNAALAEPYLTWQPGSGSISGYRIYFGKSANNYPQYHQIGNVTEYPISNIPLEDDTTYYFRVRAFNSSTESGPTNEVTFRTNDTTPPAPPNGLRAY